MFGVLVLSYLLVCVGVVVAANAILQDRALRILFIVLGFLVPPVAVWAFLRTIWGSVRAESIRYVEDLGRIEDEIEAERVSVFGGHPLEPSLSERWMLAYAESLSKAAKKVERMTGFPLSATSRS